MRMSSKREIARLSVSRQAAKLFLINGVSETSGHEIAEAAGLSERTVWRYFRTKESCVEPLFTRSSLRFAAQLRDWPRNMSIEDYLAECFAIEKQAAEDIEDNILVVRLLSILPDEPDLRAAWLISCHEGEQALLGVIADRVDRSINDFEVRLCAAAVTAAVRTIDESISLAAVKFGQTFKLEDVVQRLAQAIRAVSPLPFCDPSIPSALGS